MSEVNLTTVLKQGQKQLAAAMDGEMIMMQKETGSYFSADETGVAVWELIDGKRSVAEICTELAGKYSAEQSVVQADVLPFAKKLVEFKLAEIVNG